MIDGLTRLLLEKYKPDDLRLAESVETPESEQVQKSVEDMSPSLIAVITKELEKAAKRKKDNR